MPSNRRIRCYRCGAVKLMHIYSYKKNIIKYDAQNVSQLSAKYLCRKCRLIAKQTATQVNLTKAYKKAQLSLQEQVNEYIKRGVNDSNAFLNFKANVTEILNSYNIKNFEYVINDNVLKGITIQKIPFLNEIFIPLNVNNRR